MQLIFTVFTYCYTILRSLIIVFLIFDLRIAKGSRGPGGGDKGTRRQGDTGTLRQAQDGQGDKGTRRHPSASLRDRGTGGHGDTLVCVSPSPRLRVSPSPRLPVPVSPGPRVPWSPCPRVPLSPLSPGPLLPSSWVGKIPGRCFCQREPEPISDSAGRVR